MTDQFDGDVAIPLTLDGGQIDYIGGQPVMDAGGLENAVNISLFTWLGWWGNAIFENEPDNMIGSDFEITVRPRAISNKYLRAVEQAAKSALVWMVNANIAKSVDTAAEWPELNTVLLLISIEKQDSETMQLRYELAWENGFLYPVTAKVN